MREARVLGAPGWTDVIDEDRGGHRDHGRAQRLLRTALNASSAHVLLHVGTSKHRPLIGFFLLTAAVSWVLQAYPALNRRRFRLVGESTDAVLRAYDER